eukprot:SAG22_NODE_623_length_8459_cov_39.989474_6_plen_198_part_00
MRPPTASAAFFLLALHLQTLHAQDAEFKVIGSSGSGQDSAKQQAMLDQIKKMDAKAAAAAAPKSFSAEDMAKMGYKTRSVPPPKDSNETQADRELRKAYALVDDDAAVARLLQNGASVYAADGNKQGHVHFAAFRSKLKVLKLLLAEGANVDQTDNAKVTPLFLAACASHTRWTPAPSVPAPARGTACRFSLRPAPR